VEFALRDNPSSPLITVQRLKVMLLALIVSAPSVLTVEAPELEVLPTKISSGTFVLWIIVMVLKAS
jgi:hypothetical protein